jgi:hypothetical protein
MIQRILENSKLVAIAEENVFWRDIGFDIGTNMEPKKEIYN